MADDQNPGTEGATPRPIARVLIVDDEESIRRLVSKWSDVSGYEVKAASSAEAALLIMHAWTADVVVCDIRMPRYSGVWLIEHLRTLYPSVSIVISTGYGEIDPALMVHTIPPTIAWSMSSKQGCAPFGTRPACARSRRSRLWTGRACASTAAGSSTGAPMTT